MFRRLIVALALTALASGSLFAATQGGTPPIPLPAFPPNNWWNTDVSAAPLDSSSDAFIQFLGGAGRGLHPDFGGDSGDPDAPIYGFPFIIVDGNQANLTVTFTHSGNESDGVDHNNNDTPFPFYPVPSEAISQTGWVEGGLPGNVDQRDDLDRHILVVDKTNNTLYELYNVWYNGTNWEAYSGAFFDMKTNNRRPDTWTSADAAGLAIFPGLMRYDEVNGPEEIRHAFRVTVNSSNGYVFPASHQAGSATNALPMGARLRLKSAKNISTFPADVQKIFRAFKKYGLIVADNGSDMFISGTYDTRWNNDVLNPAFSALKASDFEVVQRGWKPPFSLVLTLPNPMGAGDAASGTVTVYDSNYNLATGFTGTIHFTATDGAATLPVNYTFIAGDAGSHTFPSGFTLRTAGSQIVTVTSVSDATVTGSKAVTVGPATPTGLVANTITTTRIDLSWTPVSGAAQYEVVRSSAASAYATVTTTASTSYSDTSVAAGATYVYEVRALDASSRPSPYSAPDAATTILFTDDPLVATGTIIKAVHVTELRQAINAMRAAAGIGAASFADSSLSGMAVKVLHLQELRTALTPARSALGLSAVAFTDPSAAAGTVIKASHLQELRAAVK